MASENNSGEFTLQPDGSYGMYQVQPDGTTWYYQQLPTGEYGYFKPEADGTQSYFRQQADGSFVQWVRLEDGSYAAPEAVAVPVAAVPAAAAPMAAAVPSANRGRGGLIAGIAAGAVVLLGAAGVGLFMMLKGDDSSGGSAGASVPDIADKAFWQDAAGPSTTGAFIADIAEEPSLEWAHSFPHDDYNRYWTVVPAGEHYLVAIAQSNDSWGAGDSRMSMIDMRNGDMVWDKSIDTITDGQWSVTDAQSINGSDNIAVSLYNENFDQSRLLIVDARTGNELAAFELDGDSLELYSDGSRLFVADLSYMDQDRESKISAYRMSNLSGTALWTFEFPATYLTFEVFPSFVSILADELHVALNSETGEPSAVSHIVTDDTGFLIVNDTLLHYGYNIGTEESELMAIDDNGHDLWDKPATGESFLLTADALYMRMSLSDTMKVPLMRINLTDGTEMWDAPLEIVEHPVISDDQGEVFYIRDGERAPIYQVNSDTGELIDDIGVNPYETFLGENTLYVHTYDHVLVAFNKSDLTVRWQLQLGGSEYLGAWRSHLYLVDQEDWKVTVLH